MTELEERIVSFLVEETRIKAKKVQLSSRLADDVGMDGDDAVRIFEKFSEKFHVDLATLHEHWDDHFYPEGFDVPPVACLFIIGASAIVGDLVHDTVKLMPLWVSMIGVAVLFLWIYDKFFVEPQPRKVPVTVQDLVDAADSGNWAVHYEEPVATLFRTLQ